MASALRYTLLRLQFQAASSPRGTLTNLPTLRMQQSLTSRMSRSAFQTSAARRILPPLPQVIKGSVNDPVSVPTPHPSHGSYHWTTERLVSIGLIPITIAPFAVGSLNPLLDGTLIGLILLHTYIGFQYDPHSRSVICDYIPTWRMPGVRKACDWLNVLALFVVGWGWYEFETNDVGLTEGIKRIWKAGATAKDAEKQAEGASDKLAAGR